MAERDLPDDTWAQWCRDVERFLAWCDAEDPDGPAGRAALAALEGGEQP